MNFIVCLRALLLLGLVIGCGAKKNGQSTSNIPVPSTVDLSYFHEKVTFDTTIPEGLGLLLTRKINSVGTCTAFLIDDHYALTNSHCLTNILAEDCSKNVQLHFNTNNGVQIRSCKKIVQTSGPGKGSILKPDFSVIELSKPVELTANEFKVSRDGFEDKDQLIIKSLDVFVDTDKNIFAAYKISECQTFSHSMIGNFSERRSSVIPMFSPDSSDACKLEEANSGSPVLKKNGKVVGILYVEPSELRSAKGETKKAKTVPYYLTTNLSCLKFKVSSVDQNRDKGCDAFLKDEVNYQDQMINKVAVAEKLTLEVKRTLKTLPKVFKYKNDQKVVGNVTQISFRPECVYPLESWSPEDKQKIDKSFLGKKSYRTEVPYFSINPKYKFDSYFRYSVDVVALEAGRVEYHISNLKNLKKKEMGNMRVISYLMNKKISNDIEIGLCEEQ